MAMSVVLIAVVFGISLVLTMVGLGGGLIYSPLFLILGMVKSQAAPASLFLNLVAVASAAYTYSRNKMVDFSLSIPLIISSSLTAPIGAYLNIHIKTEPFFIIMAAVLALAGVRMLISPSGETAKANISPTVKAGGGIAIGASIGLMGGLLGIGGGVFVVPLLIYVLKTPTKIAAASSTFIVCFSSLTGFLGYASMEEMNWGFLLPAALACLIGGRAGAKIMSARMTDKYIHVIFSGILFIMCAKLLHQSLF
jgi:uncharacterized membrane protein YfcA